MLIIVQRAIYGPSTVQLILQDAHAQIGRLLSYDTLVRASCGICTHLQNTFLSGSYFTGTHQPKPKRPEQQYTSPGRSTQEDHATWPR